MSSRIDRLDRLRIKAQRRIRLATKRARQRLGPVDRAGHRTLLILGCQRSGTTMLSEMFERDPSARVFGELGELFRDEPDNHRLRPLAEVNRRLARDPAGLVVVKPLVESQRTAELLDGISGSRAVWLYRDHRDVAASNLRRFGVENGRRNIERLLAAAPDDWRADRVSAATRTAVEAVAHDLRGPHDAAALFWWCRNRLWFEQDLAADERVRLCRYETLVRAPDEVLGGIYDHLDMRPPPPGVTAAVHTGSIGRGDDTPLHPNIRAMCDELLVHLDEAWASR